jgi:DNA-binding transcriptional regulator YhcF (GntR family)
MFKKLLVLGIIFFLFFSLPFSQQQNLLNKVYSSIRAGIVFISTNIFSFISSNKEEIKASAKFISTNVEKDIESIEKQIPKEQVQKGISTYEETLLKTIKHFGEKTDKK